MKNETSGDILYIKQHHTKNRMSAAAFIVESSLYKVSWSYTEFRYSYIENHIKWSYRVVVHEPKNRSRESLATKVDIPDCPGLSRTVNPLFLAQHDIGFEIKDQGTGHRSSTPMVVLLR